MLPASYIQADTRNVTPVCPQTQRIGIGFYLMTGGVVRMALSLKDARWLRDCLNGYINSPAGTQSPGSELSPSVPMSVPSEGVNT